MSADDEQRADEANGERVPFLVELPALLLDVLRHAAHRRGWTVDQLAREILAEWAIGEIRN